MKIRSKIIFVIIPIIVASVLSVGVASYFSAYGGINNLARNYLGFKVKELNKYAMSQWMTLKDNGVSEEESMIDAAKGSVSVYSEGLIETESELIFAIDANSNIAFSTRNFNFSEDDKKLLMSFFEKNDFSLIDLKLSDGIYVSKYFYFAPFDWCVFVTNEKSAFYSAITSLLIKIVSILLIFIVISVLVLFLLTSILTRPIKNVVDTMENVIESGDLSEKVKIEYNDEIGNLGHTFNLMTTELDNAYSQIKNFAFQAVLAKKNEAKIRNIFQKYVPQDLINQFFENPEEMLVGNNRNLSVLFSDIRSFTTISESMAPDDLVNSLNEYFTEQVDIIMDRNGIVDKYIGDAIMAFFGAPVAHEDDPLQSVLAAIEMSEKVKSFNKRQIEKGKPEFRIGVGVNYGICTVGNIGTEKKMDYTVIGDTVNLASRLEGLTKKYKQELIISEFLYEEVKDSLPCRLIDAVAVKGKTKGVKIYTVKKSLSDLEAEAWTIHNKGMLYYYDRNFIKAMEHFDKVLEIIPDDFCSNMMRQRCEEYKSMTLPDNWDGVEVMKTK